MRVRTVLRSRPFRFEILITRLLDPQLFIDDDCRLSLTVVSNGLDHDVPCQPVPTHNQNDPGLRGASHCKAFDKRSDTLVCPVSPSHRQVPFRPPVGEDAEPSALGEIGAVIARQKERRNDEFFYVNPALNALTKGNTRSKNFQRMPNNVSNCSIDAPAWPKLQVVYPKDYTHGDFDCCWAQETIGALRSICAAPKLRKGTRGDPTSDDVFFPSLAPFVVAALFSQSSSVSRCPANDSVRTSLPASPFFCSS